MILQGGNEKRVRFFEESHPSALQGAKSSIYKMEAVKKKILICS